MSSQNGIIKWSAELGWCFATFQVLYREKDCEFLLSSTDPVQHYEDLGMMNTSGSSVEEKGLKALEGVDRTVAVEMIHGGKLQLLLIIGFLVKLQFGCI